MTGGKTAQLGREMETSPLSPRSKRKRQEMHGETGRNEPSDPEFRRTTTAGGLRFGEGLSSGEVVRVPAGPGAQQEQSHFRLCSTAFLAFL